MGFASAAITRANRNTKNTGFRIFPIQVMIPLGFREKNSTTTKNLLTSARSRWDEAITKNEAIALLRSVYTHKLVECNAKGTLLTSSSTSTNKTTTVKKTTATKKQTVKIKKYKSTGRVIL